MRALLLDVGNSRLKWGVFDGQAILETGSVPLADTRADDFSALVPLLPADVDTAIASNVAGKEFGEGLRACVQSRCGCALRFARTAEAAYGITNSYAAPADLGVDRWAAMVGAYAERATACLVVDAGTAVTIDALDNEGRHLGGEILPGVALMAKALAASTSDIGLADPAGGDWGAGDVFGTSTPAAVVLGAINAVVGAVERAQRAMQARGLEPDIILTGGDASRILGALDAPVLERPHLVLAGLAHMLDDDS